MACEIVKHNFFKLQSELKVARSEIHNLRQQIRSLKSHQQKEIDELNNRILTWKCPTCPKDDVSSSNALQDEFDEKSIVLEPIGYISTEFSAKRGIPRQSSLCPQLLGKLTILKNVFNNPEHALEGLHEYSHMWILFYFNRNESKHNFAKVSPPRLNGDKTGVFATRSPHRPSPIGLSLVRINSIEDSTIFFSGVDMLDKTPVIDIKPYIPQYDDPIEQEFETSVELIESKGIQVRPGSPGINPGNREDPDGEESDDEQALTTFVHPLSQNVRVPLWVMPSYPKSIIITSEAEEQLNNLGKAELKPVIQKILNEDPRSSYIKQRYYNQFYTFLISDLHISCKFDDASNSVNVYRINKATKFSSESEIV